MNTIKLPRLSLQVASTQRGLQRVENMLGSVKSLWNLGEDTYKRIRAAVTEAVKNAMQSGSKPGEDKTITVGMHCAGDQCEFTVQDESKEGGSGNCVTMKFDTSGKA